jgi:hypothetical protein
LGNVSLDRSARQMRLDRIERKRLLGHDSKDRTVGTGELGTRVLEQDSWSRTAGAGKECWSRKAGAGPLNVDTRQNPRRHVVFIKIQPNA